MFVKPRSERKERSIHRGLKQPVHRRMYAMEIAGGTIAFVAVIGILLASGCGLLGEPAATAVVEDAGDCPPGSQPLVWYLDADGDGYGNIANPVAACNQPVGYVADNTDCIDSDATIHEGCGASGREGSGDTAGNMWYADRDGDGLGDPLNSQLADGQPPGYVSDGTDCDDADPNMLGERAWYLDADGDGYVDPTITLLACQQPTDYLPCFDVTCGDCDDTNPDVHDTCGGETGQITPIAAPVSPGSRAHDLHEQGYSAVDIAQALIEEFSTSQDELLEILAAEGFSVHDVYLVLDSLADAPPHPYTFIRLLNEHGYPPVEIAQVLMDEYVSVADELVWILSSGGFSAHDVYLVLQSYADTQYPPLSLIAELRGYYPGVEIAQVLIDEYDSLEDELPEVLVELGFSARDYYTVLVDLYSYSEVDAWKELRTQGFTAREVVDFLVAEFGLDEQEVTQVMKDDGYGADEIASAVKDAFAVTVDPLGVAQIHKDNGGSAMEIGNFLKNDYNLNSWYAVRILETVGYSTSDIYQVLRQVFTYRIEQAWLLLDKFGHNEDEIFGAVTGELAVTFAPHLRFDNSSYSISPTIHYPMSAQTYYEVVIAGSGPNISNTDPNLVTSSEVPTYWKATKCGNQIRIVYWWFYGRQDCCDGVCPGGEGEHNGDWEQIMVILSEDMNLILAVTFYQHGRMYTRIAVRSGFEFFGYTHPVVYVGRQAHGSYHYIAYDQSCCYWADSRNGNYPHLKTWENLIELRPSSEGGESWMDADLVGGFYWGEIGTHPMQITVPCLESTCSGTPIWGCHKSGCWRSQCEVGDRDDGITCWHCPSGYIDWGTFCVKDCGTYPFCSSTSISTYGLRYTISQTDLGLLYKNPY